MKRLNSVESKGFIASIKKLKPLQCSLRNPNPKNHG
jgi:hypothetical protein